MSKLLFKDAVGWGLVLWIIGYALGFVFFAVVPASLIGWVIMPIGVVITLWVLIKKIRSNSFGYYVAIAVAWTAIAVLLDYFLIVRLLHPLDGYYKLDVYLYYALTFTLPIIVSWYKKQPSNNIPKMGFHKDVVPQVLNGKISTWRLRDHNLRVGDVVAFENSQTGEIFGSGEITKVVKTTVGRVDLDDETHYKTYKDRQELIEAFKRHNPDYDVNNDTPMFAYTYRFTKAKIRS